MTYNLDKSGIKQIEDLIRKRILSVKKETALSAFDFLLNFGYHAVLKPMPYDIDKGWTWYYAANWNIGVGSIDMSVIDPMRPIDHEYPEEYRPEWSDKKNNNGMLSKIDLEKAVYVTNSVYYGPWLNNGNIPSNSTFWRKSKPNRFIEHCESNLRRSIPGIIRKVKSGG